jgi:hypothetical protein
MKKSSLLLWLMVSLAGCNCLRGQDIQWEKSYGGKHADYLFDAQPTADYGFILAGSSLSGKTGTKTGASRGDLDYWVWKMDENGELDWQKSFGGSGMDLLQSVQVTGDGGFILAGSSRSDKGGDKKENGMGNGDFWIIKLNAKGDEEWQRTIGGGGQEQLQSICPTIDGGYIVGGTSASDKSKKSEADSMDFYGKSENSFGSLDYWVVKLDRKGKIEWQRTLGGENADILKSVEQTKDGGYILGGYSNSPESGAKTEKGYGRGDYWIIKLDKDGQAEWQKELGGEGDDQICTVHQTVDGDFIAAGNSGSETTGNKSKSNRNGMDLWLVKFDSQGTILWQETYDTGKADMLTSVVENPDHSMLIGGFAMSEKGRSGKSDKEDINDFVAIKINVKGEELWKRTIGSAGDEVLRKVIETRDGGYLMAGTSNGQVSRDKNSNVGGTDFWVVKLKDKEKPKEKPQVIEAIPNPAQQFTNIVVGYEFEKGVATLYDLSGRQLQQFAIYDRTVPIDMSGLPEGIYVVQIRTNKSTDSVKVIKGIEKN